MDSFVDERDYKLLNSDRYTFSVLTRIIGGECELLLSDHERIIMCFTCQPYPAWIWTPDDASEEEMETVYRLAQENNLLDGGHRLNMKYDLAEYFMKRAAKDKLMMTIETNMFAYDCPESVPPKDIADGELHQCTYEDIDQVVEFFDMFHNAIDNDKMSREEYRRRAEEGIKYGVLYLWKNADGEYTASCNWHPIREMASVGMVFTRTEFRRKHYAENLVYQVTEIARKAGFLPMLYTDADYVASNACYEKIGYVLRGKLCTIK